MQNVILKQNEEKEAAAALRWQEDPRSIFGPEGTIIPAPMQRPIEINKYCGELVNRHQQLRTVWNIWSEDWCAGPGAKKTLIATGQMFGSGKTTFGRNLLNLNNVHVRKEFDKLPESAAKTAMSNALTVYIDLSVEIDAIPSYINLKSDRQFVSLLMWKCTLEQCFGIDTSKAIDFWNGAGGSNIRNVPGCLKEILKLTGRPMYFHFDEVDALGSSKVDRFDFSVPNTTKDYVLSRYYKFWKAVMSLLDKSFVYVSGKTVQFCLRGAGKMSLGYDLSALKSNPLLLPRLELSDISDILNAGYIETFDLVQSDQHDRKLELVSQAVHHWSSGIPRLLEHSLTFLSSLPNPAGFLLDYIYAEQRRNDVSISDNDRDAAAYLVESADEKVFDYFIDKDPGINIPDFRKCNDEQRRLLEAVLYACASELSFSGHLPMFGSNYTAMELSELFGVYITPTQNNGVMFTMPQMWKYYFARHSTDRSLSFTHANFWNVKPFMADKDSALVELVIGMVMVQSVLRSDSTLRFLAETESCVKNRNLSELVTSGVYRMSDNVYKGNNAELLLRLHQDKTFIAKSAAKDDFVECLILCKKEPSDKVRYLIGIQAKAYNSTHEMDMSIVNEEMQKFARFVHLSRQELLSAKEGSYPPSALFVLVWTGRLSNKVQQIAGKVWKNSSDIPEYSLRDNTSTEPDICIPAGMELLVLSKPQRDGFLLDVNLNKFEHQNFYV